jgi:hypothetical protein
MPSKKKDGLQAVSVHGFFGVIDEYDVPRYVEFKAFTKKSNTLRFCAAQLATIVQALSHHRIP